MSSREGRGRPHRDYPVRSEEKSHHGRGGNPPSRHLWVGNLPHSLTENALAHLFLQFGELETVAFQPGRSYAFINYINDRDAFAAIKELQDFVFGGNPLRIEFAKAEKSSFPPHDADYIERRDEPHLMARGSPFSQRNSRVRRSSPDPPYLNKSKIHDKDGEPSEVLWIGFPAQLKVDEFTLRKAFSPFGEIEKITAFPGRTYAFVRFRTVMAARRAKEALHGKLFGNPRVHICFAKNESGPTIRERSSVPPSPHGRTGSSDHRRYLGGSSGDPSTRSAPYIPKLGPGDPDGIGLSAYDAYEQRRYPGQVSEPSLRRNIYSDNSPPRDISVHFQEFSPQKLPHEQGAFYEDDPWDLPEDVSFLHESKKLKTSSFAHENELPEYPFSDLERVKWVPSHEIPRPGVLDRNFDSRPSGYRPIPAHSTQPFRERGDQWNDNFVEVGHVQLPLPPFEKRNDMIHGGLRESSSSSTKEVWKWEGVIAKGGNPVCGARCFPVGKPPDVFLPGILDCTARTNLDMLAKHYYQASSASVVFFVPANDPDITYYNEFMNFLGEKQRAAVAKLDERTTLFLVPPSEFSEKVLKVPGRLSMSGVVLRLLDSHGSSSTYGGTPQPHENPQTTNFTASFQNDAFQISPSGPYLPAPPIVSYDKPGVSSVAPPIPVPGNYNSMSNMPVGGGLGHDNYVQKQPKPTGPNCSTHDMQMQNPNASSSGSMPPSRPIMQQEAAPNNRNYSTSGISAGSSIPSEQLAQLASSLLGQQGGRQSGGVGVSATGEYKPSDQPGYSFKMPQNYNDQGSSEFSPSQFGQVQQLQQQQQQPPNAYQRDVQVNQQQQLQNGGGQEDDDTEGDPQKRLQATLQLAAALLQQIQRGKNNN